MKADVGHPGRYVVLHHTGIAKPHFDFMLEVESGKPLKTWQLPGWPLDRFVYDAVALDAHRNEYLNYEGPVSRDRGTVRRVEGGNCTIRSLAGVSYTLTLATGVELWLFRDTRKGMDNKARRAWKASAVNVRPRQC